MSSKKSDDASAPSNSAASADPSSTADAASPAHEQTLVQYIIMRSDLVKQHKWNVGGLIANGSHAAVAVIAEQWQDKDVQQYVTGADGKQMHTVVLAANDEKELMDTAGLLQENKIVHKVWVSSRATLRRHIALLSARQVSALLSCSPVADCARFDVLSPCVLWRQMEQPDQLPSCLATRPYHRHILQPILRHLKLFR